MLKYLLCFIWVIISVPIKTKAQTWLPVGDSTQRFMYDSVTPYGNVFALRHIDSLMYVGGSFKYTGNIKANGIAKWNGSVWKSLGNGMGNYGATLCIEKYQNTIIIGSHYAFLGFDGTEWNLVGNALTTGDVNVLKIFNNRLYLGGSNIKLNNVQMNNIAGWDGSNYSDLAGGLIGTQVIAMCIYNDELIVGGQFSKAGNTTAFNIAAWNGTNWHDLDFGVTGGVDALCVDSINNFLYAAGPLFWVGQPPCSYSARFTKWDGFQWHAFGDNYPGISPKSLALYNNNIYIGSLSQSGLITDTVFVKFDGINFTPILGPDNGIRALEVYNNELYVGGYFKKINNDTMIGIARYYAPPDTTSCLFIQPLMHAMPFGTKAAADTIYTTAPYHIQFYTNNKYASTWAWDFGDGGTGNTREPEHTYAAPGTYNVTLEVLHPHNLSSQVCTLNVAKTITIIDNTAVKETAKDTIECLGQNIPNPFSHSTSIPYYVPYGSKGLMQIHNAAGGLVGEYSLQEGKQMLEVSMKELKTGAYYYSIVIDGVVKGSRKMVVGDE